MREIARTRVASADAPYRHDIDTDRNTLVADEPLNAGGIGIP
jgi:hypothetical protein